jgi:hypothetical protein
VDRSAYGYAPYVLMYRRILTTETRTNDTCDTHEPRYLMGREQTRDFTGTYIYTHTHVCEEPRKKDLARDLAKQISVAHSHTVTDPKTLHVRDLTLRYGRIRMYYVLYSRLI